MSSICPTCKQKLPGPVEISEMTQEEFIKRKLDLGYIDFKVFGCTISELREIINFAVSRGYVKNETKRC